MYRVDIHGIHPLDLPGPGHPMTKPQVAVRCAAWGGAVRCGARAAGAWRGMGCTMHGASPFRTLIADGACGTHKPHTAAAGHLPDLPAHIKRCPCRRRPPLLPIPLAGATATTRRGRRGGALRAAGRGPARAPYRPAGCARQAAGVPGKAAQATAGYAAARRAPAGPQGRATAPADAHAGGARGSRGRCRAVGPQPVAAAAAAYGLRPPRLLVLCPTIGP